MLHIDPSEWLLFRLRFNITTEITTMTNTVASTAPTEPETHAAILIGHSVLLQGVLRFSSVSTLVQETVASFGVQVRVFFKTPRLPQLSVHSGSSHSPSMWRSGGMRIQLQNSKTSPTQTWRPVAFCLPSPLHCHVAAR